MISMSFAEIWKNKSLTLLSANRPTVSSLGNVPGAELIGQSGKELMEVVAHAGLRCLRQP